MECIIAATMYRKFIWAGIAVLIILIVGTIGYWILGEGTKVREIPRWSVARDVLGWGRLT